MTLITRSLSLASLLVLFAAPGAQASLFDDKVELPELAQAMANCAGQRQVVQDLIARGAFVGSVEGKFSPLRPATANEGAVTSKTYLIDSRVAYGIGRTRPSARLLIVATTTQPAPGRMDAPARTTYLCNLYPATR